MKIKDTLNLPQTDFLMKANLSQREPLIIEFWEQIDLYSKMLEKNKDKPKYVLHDGPPYANGDIHVGHTLNKVIKDIVNKFKTMQGFQTPYVPGWDTHGQPIEHNVLKTLGDKRKTIADFELRKKCHEYAMKFVDRQRDEFKRLGIIGDWQNPYLTLDHIYEAKNIEIFGSLFEKGLIYKGRKPIHWCYHCSTALAEAEIEYADERSPSIYLKFKIIDDKGKLGLKDEDKHNVSFVVWTTTPWTLPANVALALDSIGIYNIVESNGDKLIVLEDLTKQVFEIIERPYKILKTIKGEDLEGIIVSHPLYKKESVVVLADFIAKDTGSGVVHIAPGHGQEDYQVGIKYGLEMPMPVDDYGVFTFEAERFEGLKVTDANKTIVEDLEKNNLLLKLQIITHSYPHCWRCHKPVIFRATEQWFVSMGKIRSLDSGVESKETLRESALGAISEVKWIPEWSKSRIETMVSDRPDWCISRQRTWGVPLPVFTCIDCSEAIVNSEIIEKVRALFEKEGADSWYQKSAAEILGKDVSCPKCSSKNVDKEMNILDVWFESGISSEAVLKSREDLQWPADLYVEGSDQHRGWFQSSLLLSVGHQKKAPFKSVLTHGFVVDENGRKMSKSLGNVVDPLDVIKQSGADILRLWVASSDFTTDVAISPEILKRTSEAYRRIRNTLRFLLANLYDFNSAKMVDYNDLRELDKWVLSKLQGLIEKITNAYEENRFHVVYHAIYNFCVVDLSSFYLDIIKDTLYTEAKDSQKRRSVQTVLFKLLSVITKLLVPVLSFTAEEVWKNLPFGKKYESAHLADWPKFDKSLLNVAIEEKLSKMQEFRDEALRALEEARVAKVIGNPLEAKIIVSAQKDMLEYLNVNKSDLPEILLVSEVEFGDVKGEIIFKSDKISGLKISVHKTEHFKCDRCWRYVSKVEEEFDEIQLCDRCAGVVKAGISK